MSNADPIVASESRPISLRVRPDLRFEQNAYQGQTSWVVKDPVALKYYRLAEEEHWALKMLDGETSMQEIKKELERRFPPWIVEYSELQSLLGMFHRCGLVLAEADGQGEQLFERNRKQKQKQMVGKLASILWIRLPGVDPERFLSWGYPKVRWFFTKWCFGLCMLFALSALMLLFVHMDEFYLRLPSFHQFFGVQNAAWLMIALIVSKILHELGHGMACKHFGGECHEIGIMFLVFTPCLYCDTSDSWMLGNRWHRAAIGAAGMYVEIILAAICTYAWWYTEPGLVHYLCLSTMFVCSVSTLLFNSNPLLRFDGYYILSDILEIPNLAQKGRSALLAVLRHWCLGMPWNEQQQSLPPRRRTAFAIYAVASVVYRFMILFFILWFLSKVFEPYGLQPLGHLMIAMSLFGITVMPLWQAIKFFRVPGRTRQVKTARLLATSVLLTSVILAVIYIPIPHRVLTTLVVRPRDAERIYVSMAGNLDKVHIRPGEQVTADSAIAELTNLDLMLEIQRLDGQCKVLEKRLKNLKRQRDNDPSAVTERQQTQEELQSIEAQKQLLEEDLDRLLLVCRTDGYVIPPPERPASKESSQLPTWYGSPLDKQNLGSWMETSTLLCMIGDPGQMEAVLVIDQSDMEFVRQGQSVEIQLDEYVSQTLRGKITEIATSDLEVAPPELSNKAKGELSTETDESGSERPMSTSYQATVPLDGLDVQLLPGFRGRAKILTGSRTLGQILWRNVLETFRFG